MRKGFITGLAFGAVTVAMLLQSENLKNVFKKQR